jgi:HSP20 family protein
MIPMARRNGPAPSPWDEFAVLRREMNDLLGSVAPARAARPWAPPVSVREDNDAIHVELELPGVDPDEVDITLEERTLTIAGEKRAEQQREQDSYRLVERWFGRFERTFTLGRDVDAEHVQATYDRGVLTVRLPRLEESKPRRIRVGVGEGRQIESASA